MEGLRGDTNWVMMQVEHKFGIVVYDSEAENIHTMGQFYSLILAEVGQRPQHVCVSSATFHRLRGVLGEMFNIPRERVRTTSRLEDFIPVLQRKRHWRQLSAVLGDPNSPHRGVPGGLRDCWSWHS